MLGIKDGKYVGLSNFMELFYEQWKPYAEQWKIAEKNIRNMVQNFAEKMKPVRAFCILGEYQFTYWKPLCFSEIDRIVNARDVNEYLMEKIEDKSFIDYDTLCDEMVQSELLSNTNKAILNQCVQAMNMHRDFPDAITRQSKGHAYDMSSNIFKILPEIFFDTEPFDGQEYIKIVGRDNQRTVKYIRRIYVNNVENLNYYKLFVAQANGSGLFGEAISPPIIAEPGMGHTETFLSIGKFSSYNEAASLEKYI